MKIRTTTPKGRGKWKTLDIEHGQEDFVRTLNVNDHKRTETVWVRLTDEQKLVLSWSEIEFFATIYHKYKEPSK